jgi:hypothetical protein
MRALKRPRQPALVGPANVYTGAAVPLLRITSDGARLGPRGDVLVRGRGGMFGSVAPGEIDIYKRRA